MHALFDTLGQHTTYHQAPLLFTPLFVLTPLWPSSGARGEHRDDCELVPHALSDLANLPVRRQAVDKQACAQGSRMVVAEEASAHIRSVVQEGRHKARAGSMAGGSIVSKTPAPTSTTGDEGASGGSAGDESAGMRQRR